MYGTEFSRTPAKRKTKMSDARFLVLAISFGLVFIGASYLLITTSIVSPILIGIGVVTAIASQIKLNGHK